MKDSLIQTADNIIAIDSEKRPKTTKIYDG